MCDADVKTCNPLAAFHSGKILDCLATKTGQCIEISVYPDSPSSLSEDFAMILSIAQPPDFNSAFDSYFQVCTAPLLFRCCFDHLQSINCNFEMKFELITFTA